MFRLQAKLEVKTFQDQKELESMKQRKPVVGGRCEIQGVVVSIFPRLIDAQLSLVPTVRGLTSPI